MNAVLKRSAESTWSLSQGGARVGFLEMITPDWSPKAYGAEWRSEDRSFLADGAVGLQAQSSGMFRKQQSAQHRRCAGEAGTGRDRIWEQPVAVKGLTCHGKVFAGSGRGVQDNFWTSVLWLEWLKSQSHQTACKSRLNGGAKNGWAILNVRCLWEIQVKYSWVLTVITKERRKGESEREREILYTHKYTYTFTHTQVRTEERD